MYKGKRYISKWAALGLALLGAGQAFGGGIDIGNGGLGVYEPDGKIHLFDFEEHADLNPVKMAHQNNPFTNPQSRVNFNLAIEARATGIFTKILGPQVSADTIKLYADALATPLSAISDRHPILVARLLQLMSGRSSEYTGVTENYDSDDRGARFRNFTWANGIDWEKTDHIENTNDYSDIVRSSYKTLQCALWTNQVVQLSMGCLNDQMSNVDTAGLLTHEALYIMVRSSLESEMTQDDHLRKMLDDSDFKLRMADFTRQINALIFSAAPNTSIEENLKKSIDIAQIKVPEFTYILEQEKDLVSKFFGSQPDYTRSTTCSLNGSLALDKDRSIDSITISFRNGLSFDAKMSIKHNAANAPNCDEDFSNYSKKSLATACRPSAKSQWMSDLPVYDYNTESFSFVSTNSTTTQVLNITVPLDHLKPAQIQLGDQNSLAGKAPAQLMQVQCDTQIGK